MKIDDYKVGTSFIIPCTKFIHPTNNEVCYRDFEISKQHSKMWGRNPEDVIEVKATIIEEDIIVKELLKNSSKYDSNQIDYFGWIDFDNNELNIHMIYPNIKMYFICFPYGPDISRFWRETKDLITNKIIHNEGDRRGMTVRLKIEEI